MAQLFANNARSELAQPVNTTSTSITLTSGTGARFPMANLAGDYFLLTIYNLAGNVETDIEIVRVTSRTGDVLTVQRAQEGTTAKTYLAGAKCELRLTADSLNTIDAIDVTADTITSRGTIVAMGTVAATGGFFTSGDSFLGEITVDGTATFNQQVNATMGLAANTISVTGATTLAGLSTSGAFTANGAVVLASAVSLTGDQIQVSEGGTGATTAAAARTNLDVYSKAEADSRFINITDTDLTLTNGLIVNGVNGISTTALSANGAFALTGDQVQISEGGTGATTASAARANLGTVSDTAANGIAVRTSANTLTARALTAGTGVSIANPDGVAGNPSITNTGVLAITTNTGLSANANATGSVTITNVDRGSAQNIFKNITNAAGTTQFSATNNNDSLSIAASGTASVMFDNTNRRITITTNDQFTGTVTSVAVTGGNGLTVTGSPITTSGTINVTTNATAMNTAGTIVSRDIDGNFAAGVITASLVGNASTATAWATPRTITLAGSVTGSASVDGTGDVSITTTVAPNSVALGTDTTGNYVSSVAVSGVGLTVDNAPGEGTAITVTSNATNVNTASTVVARDASGNFAAGTITAALTGNASTATTLQTARTINGVSFNGSANITVTANTPTALTFNNGGAGGASGSTFNGGTALTVSYNTVGAPSTTGTGASGTWAINITGNAATATSATNSTNSNVTATSAAAEYPLVFAPDATTGQKALLMDSSGGTYNPSTNTATINVTGNAATATALQTARTINGTSFNGTANITTASWGTARTISLTGAVTGSASVDGSANVSIATTLAAGVSRGMQVFTASGTFTIPAGVTQIKATAVGGGGGASIQAPVNSTGAGRGGGGGATAVKFYSNLTPGGTLTVTVGAGGAAGDSAVSSGAGGSGGTSSLTNGTQAINALQANGGTGGNTTGSPGNGGNIPLAADISVPGGSGAAGRFITLASGEVLGAVGEGGNSLFSPSTVSSGSLLLAASSGVTGSAGRVYGQGGTAGATNSTTATRVGYAGAPGIVIIEW